MLSVTASARSTSVSPRSRAAATTRCFISAAALSVNVSPRISLPRQFRLRFQQVADALGDDARLARARAGHHHERPFAVLRGGALLGIELNARRRRAGMFKRSAM